MDLFIEVLENIGGSLNTEGNANRNFRNMPGHCAMKKKIIVFFLIWKRVAYSMKVDKIQIMINNIYKEMLINSFVV